MEPTSMVVLLTSIVTYFCIYIMLALSTNLEYGYTGIPNFGKVFYYAVGASVSAIIASRLYNAFIGAEDVFSAPAATQRVLLASKNPLLAIGIFALSTFMGALVAGVLGYLSSYPALRLTEDFLAITLLVFGEAGRIIMRTYEPLIGGVYGISGIPNPFRWVKYGVLSRALYTVIVVAFTVFTFMIVERLANSPFGRVMKAIRDDELAAKVLGKDAARVKGQVLLIGSVISGIAGSLYTFYSQAIFPDDFVPPFTFFIISMVLLGGTSNNVGVILGSILLAVVDRFTQASTLSLIGLSFPFDITYARYMLIGLIMVLVLMLRPEGLVPEKPVKTPALKVLSESINQDY